MPGELRFDPLTREWVSIVGHRQARPNLPDSGCPFCVGGLEAPDPYEVRWFTNRWPAFDEGAPIDLAAAEAAGTRMLPAVGTTEVVLYSPDHDATIGTLAVPQVRKVVDLWADRTTALYQRDDVEYVLVFENRGAEVGATISHPHGQIYAFAFVPPVPRREAEVARAQGTCTVCAELERELADGARIVFESDTWVAYVPFASAYSYGVRIVARQHVASFPALDGAGRDGLASALHDVLGRYDRLWHDDDGHAAAPFPYLLWFHQAAKHDAEHDGVAAHLHAHTAPPLRAPGVMRFVASGEVGGGTLSNPVVPEDAAATLRAV
ncbi:MAG TPA: galactose-1-phosphate uridylyltransferase [Acidimicrobiia bacterium]|jgi:UDPglucose--hexose-1-phosphate uridylyltransferase